MECRSCDPPRRPNCSASVSANCAGSKRPAGSSPFARWAATAATARTTSKPWAAGWPASSPPPDRPISVSEPEVEGAEGGLQQPAKVGGFVGQPLLVGGDGGAEGQVADQLRQQGVGPLLQATGGEAGDDVAPVGIAERAVGLEGRHVQDERHALPVGGDRVGRKVVEADDRLRERLEERAVVVALGQPFLHAPEEGIEVTPDDVVLRRVVAEEGPAGEAGGGGDVVERRLGETVADEEIEGDALQLFPAGDRGASESVVGWHPFTIALSAFILHA